MPIDSSPAAFAASPPAAPARSCPGGTEVCGLRPPRSLDRDQVGVERLAAVVQLEGDAGPALPQPLGHAARVCGRRPAPSMRVTISSESPSILARRPARGHRQARADRLDAVCATSPIQSPSLIAPAGESLARTARVTSPARTRPAAAAMAAALVFGAGLGVVLEKGGQALLDAGRLHHEGGFCGSSAACSATATMFLLFGRITTSAPGTDSTTSRICSVDGFIDWPPATMWWTPREWKMRRIPSPVATATTDVTGAGSSGAARAGASSPPGAPRTPPRPGRAGR